MKNKKSRNLVTFFCSPRNFSIRSVATDKLDMTAIYSKWKFILINRNRLFVILNHVNSLNKTLLQLTLDLLSFRHIKISHLATLQIPANILSKHCTISRSNPVKTHTFSPAVLAGIKSPAYPPRYWDTSKVKYFSPLCPRYPQPWGDVVANDWCIMVDGLRRKPLFEHSSSQIRKE